MTEFSKFHNNFMFSLIRKLFGVSIGQRSSSVEATSKKKNENELIGKRPLSIDSKKKEQQEQFLTNKKNQAVEIYEELDEISTTKKSIWQKSKEINNSYQNVNFDQISDLSSEGQNLAQDLLANFNQIRLGQTAKIQRDLYNQHSNFTAQFNHINITKQIQPQRSENPKIPRKAFKKTASPRKMRKIYQKCALCQKPITDEDSLKLACIHRFHVECEKKMRERSRWECDICEVKRKKGSIMLVAHKAKGLFSRNGVSNI